MEKLTNREYEAEFEKYLNEGTNHKAKMKEVTDADIKEWVSKQFLHGESAFKGAKAIQNGEIKHIEK
jgi:hypothetical protein